LTLINTDFEVHVDIDKLKNDYKNSSNFKTIQTTITTWIEEGNDETVKIKKIDENTTSINVKKKPYWWQFIVLSHRNLLSTLRNPGYDYFLFIYFYFIYLFFFFFTIIFIFVIITVVIIILYIKIIVNVDYSFYCYYCYFG
jgi:hypothetical protein